MIKTLKELIHNRNRAILITVGAASWILTMIKSGMPVSGGLGFWGANGHDGIWHIALASSLFRGSLEVPVFAGSHLQNYHIGFDLMLAILSKLTTIPISVWYFQLLPIFLAFSLGILTYMFVVKWTKSRNAALWSTFFVYFGGSFGFIVTLLRAQGISGESMFWSQQSISTLINPPFALSLVTFLLGIIFFSKYLKTAKKTFYILSVLFFSLLLSIKVYAGVLVLCALLIESFYELLQKRSLRSLAVFVPSLIIALLLFLPLNRGSGGLIVFQPGWFLETMLALSDRFYWPKLFEALINWRASHVYYKAIAGYLVAFIIFIVGNFGTRLLFVTNIIELKKSRLKLFSFSPITVLLAAIAVGGVLAPTLFLQAGTAWNTIQFLYYSLFVSSIFSGIALDVFLKRIKKTRIRQLMIFIVIVFTIPTSISTLSEVYLPGRPPAMLPSGEVEALHFLSMQPAGIVLTYPFDPLLAKAAIPNPPRPLYLYDSTAYVAAFGNHEVFLEDEVNLTIMNYQWKDRRKSLDDFYSSTDQKKVYSYLRDNNITYIYWVKPQFTQIGDLQLRLENIFENKSVIIYKVMN